MKIIQTRILLLALAITMMLVAGAACAPAYEYKGTVLSPPAEVPDFELTSDKGQPFVISDSNSDITLVYFGYTFCPDVCPTTMFDVKNALSKLNPADLDRVQVIFISADPERDTPEVLDQYLDNFDPNYIGLTGDKIETILSVMKPFGASAEIQKVNNSAAGYLVNHTARLYLLNNRHEIELIYDFGFEPEDLTSDLTHLLNETS